MSERVVVSGAGGLIGGRLLPVLEDRGYDVVRLVRRPAQGSGEVQWDPVAEPDGVLVNALEGAFAVVHLGGENVADGRWTEDAKRGIRDSRILSTRTLVRAMGKTSAKPAAFVCASAIGVYGDTGDQWVDESSSPSADGFLASVCKDWEQEALKAEAFGVRRVSCRIGVVLSPEGGALGRMLPIFRLGLGGPLGSGSQYMSWISLDDVVRALENCVRNDSMDGPVNLVAPEPVTNEEFSHALGAVLNRPVLFRVPEFALNLMLGSEAAEEMLLTGARVRPGALNSEGFSFRHVNLQAALEHVVA